MLGASAAMPVRKAALLRDQIMELKQQTGIAKIEPKKPVAYAKTRGRQRRRRYDRNLILFQATPITRKTCPLSFSSPSSLSW